MATIFVSSAGDNSNGLLWTTAFQSIDNAAAGPVYVDSKLEVA